MSVCVCLTICVMYIRSVLILLTTYAYRVSKTYLLLCIVREYNYDVMTL